MSITVYVAGGEDSEFYSVNGAVITTTAGRFRSAYARCALAPFGNPGGGAVYYQNRVNFSASSFWFGARVFSTISASSTTGYSYWTAVDSSNIVRLRVRCSAISLPWTMVVEKLDAAGTATQLGSSFSYAASSSVPEKFDVFVNYAVSGAITLYQGGIQIFSYTGDVTTNSVTALAGIRVHSVIQSASLGQAWSEIIVCDQDTRALNLQTLAPVANGNTHNFDTGTPAAANVNEITLDDSTLDGSTTTNQIDEYTIPAIASGTYGILAIGVSARMVKGATGPSKADLVVRSAAADYLSADKTLTLSWDTYQNWWTADPATSAPWAGLPTNIGIKSIT